jgi:ubiquinone/menaquinone biosynthesis C-methylase UbiE
MPADPAAADDQHTQPSSLVRKRYNRAARFYDLQTSMMERLAFRRLRAELWRRARGPRVLEVGVGTGASMPFYPPGAHVTAIDIAEKMLDRAARRAQQLHVDPELRQMDAQHLDFPDASFDTVVATCVFCSVPDPVQGLREALRVLTPGGQLLLLEHVRSGNRIAGRVMDWLNPLVLRLSGANINRPTVANVESAGFASLDVSSHAAGIVKVIHAQKA